MKSNQTSYPLPLPAHSSCLWLLCALLEATDAHQTMFRLLLTDTAQSITNHVSVTDIDLANIRWCSVELLPSVCVCHFLQIVCACACACVVCVCIYACVPPVYVCGWHVYVYLCVFRLYARVSVCVCTCPGVVYRPSGFL